MDEEHRAGSRDMSESIVMIDTHWQSVPVGIQLEVTQLEVECQLFYRRTRCYVVSSSSWQQLELEFAHLNVISQLELGENQNENEHGMVTAHKSLPSSWPSRHWLNSKVAV